MNDAEREEIDKTLKQRSSLEQALHRCAVVELRFEHVAQWMQEHEPEALYAILKETKDLGYDMRLEFQKKIGQITRELGGTLEL